VNPPLVTIVTPSFNQAAFLEQTLKSVLEQDYPNVEYLVVDGASTDGSQDIIRKYENRLAWWVSEPDHGQAEAINKGLTRAKGEIVAWLNSDDYYLPGAIRQAVEALQAWPQVGLVYGDVQAVDENGRLTNHLTYDDWGLSGLMQFCIIGQPAVFMRREVLQKSGFLDLSYHFLLDHQLWLRMAFHSEIKYVAEEWAAARFHADAKNIAQAAAFGKEALRVADWLLNDPQFAEKAGLHKRQIMAGAERINGRYLLDGGLPRQALAAYMRGFWQDARVVLPEWQRMAFCLASMIGLNDLRQVYLDRRQDRLEKK
jgi:glycosyltransferase involved in cell wall biosynthesis